MAAAAGFLLSNDLLIITGALVSPSGAHLSSIMCRAMNRSLISVTTAAVRCRGRDVAGDTDYGEHREITAEGAAEMLAEADELTVTPGYGMAVAQAQHPVVELTRQLRERGVNVRFCIHPIAGRLPGQCDERAAGRGEGALRHSAAGGWMRSTTISRAPMLSS